MAKSLKTKKVPAKARSSTLKKNNNFLIMANSLLQAKINSWVALVFILFVSVAVAAITMVAWVEIPQSEYSPVVGVFSNRVAIVQNGSFSQVLGESVYQPARLTSVSNKTLTVWVRPLAVESGKWNYRIEWKRTLNREGSIYISPKADRSNQVFSIAQAAQTGKEETGFILEPNTRYRLEFYSKPNAQGKLLLRKYFTVLAVPPIACTNIIKICPNGSHATVGPNCVQTCPISDNHATLQSKFLKDDPTARQIVSEILTSYSINDFKPSLANSNISNTNVFAYRVVSAIRQLGYSVPSSWSNYDDQPKLLLNKFQKLNNLSLTDIITKDSLFAIDSALARRESLDQVLANDFPLYSSGHMGDAPLNAPPKEHVAVFLDIGFRALPSSLVAWNESNFKYFAYYQLSGSLGPLPVDINGNYKFCPGIYYTESRDNCVWANSVGVIQDDYLVIGTAIHEYFHYLDKNLFGFVRETNTSAGIIDPTGFYNISYDISQAKVQAGWTFYPLRRSLSNLAGEFVNGYAQGWTQVSLPANYFTAYEDFAESSAMYVTEGNVFRELIKSNTYLQQKYNWLKQNVFNGKEYNTGNAANVAKARATPIRTDGLLVNFLADWYKLDPDFVWDYRFPVK